MKNWFLIKKTSNIAMFDEKFYRKVSEMLSHS